MPDRRYTRYDPDERDYRDEMAGLRGRAERAGRTVAEQREWEDGWEDRRQAELDALYAAGVRRWWPPYDGNFVEWCGRFWYAQAMNTGPWPVYRDMFGVTHRADPAYKYGRPRG